MRIDQKSLVQKVAACIFAACFLAPCRADAARPFIRQSAVYKAKDGGDLVYRIPALLATGKGTLLAFCEARSGSASDSAPTDLVLRRSLDNGKTWTLAQVVAHFPGFTAGNPAPVEDRKTGVIWLLLTANPAGLTEKEIDQGSPKGGRTVWITHSSDDGAHWAAAKRNHLIDEEIQLDLVCHRARQRHSACRRAAGGSLRSQGGGNTRFLFPRDLQRRPRQNVEDRRQRRT